MDLTPHLNSAALAHLVARLTSHDGVTKSQLAVAAEMTPANLREYETGVRRGQTLQVRTRIAGALGCPVEVVTCWCDLPGKTCRNEVPL